MYFVNDYGFCECVETRLFFWKIENFEEFQTP